MGGYAMTDKAQGRTFQRAVIVTVISVGCTGAAGYVMLSRLTSLQGLAILCPFGLKVLNRPLNPHHFGWRWIAWPAGLPCSNSHALVLLMRHMWWVVVMACACAWCAYLNGG